MDSVRPFWPSIQAAVQDTQRGVVYAPQETGKSNISWTVVADPGLKCYVILEVNFVRY